MASPCVVKFCKNVGNHRFPKEDERRSRWIEAIKYVKPGLSIRKNSFICSSHFTPANFISTSHFPKTSRARRLKLLKKDAVPSIFRWNKASQKPESDPEPIFNPVTVQATYSRIPRVAFVEIPPLLERDADVDKIIDPLDDIPIKIETDILEPITSANQEIEIEIKKEPANQEIEIEIKKETSPPSFLQENENMEFIDIYGYLQVQMSQN